VRESGNSMTRLRRRTLTSLLLPALAVIAVIATLWIWGLPKLAARLATRVPVEWEEALGSRAVESITSVYPVCAEPARVAAMDKMLTALTADGRGGRYTYRVQIVDAPAVNALAAPGGYIGVFQGLLAKAASAEEVAGVLAHEIEHVVQQHAVTGILRDMPMQLALASAVGSSPLGGSVAQVAYQLGSTSYQRSDERAADAGAIRILGAARISADGMLDFFRRDAGESGAESGLLNYMSSHPNSAERLAALEEAAAALPPARGPVLSAEEWAALRASCLR
jgi:predicted Zn-dependent protease